MSEDGFRSEKILQTLHSKHEQRVQPIAIQLLLVPNRAALSAYTLAKQ